jgi:GT2 family glycosyltransferase
MWVKDSLSADLSIIIVSWNTRELLRGCLSSLPQATAGWQTEITVVDNASTDGSAAMVRQDFPGCRLIESRGNVGFARANNLALSQTRASQVLLLNPDTLCPPGSLASLCDYLQGHPEAAAVGPTLLDAAGRPVATFGDFPREWMHWVSLLDPQRRWLPRRIREPGLGRAPAADRRSGPVDYVKGACLLLRQEALRTVGLLDERFFLYFEETDWCWRARAAGYQIHHCAEVAITHLEGQAAGQVSAFSVAQFQKSYRLFVAKQYGRWRLPGFRLAQACEYGWKGILRWCCPRNRQHNRALASSHFSVARLQLQSSIDLKPPPA